MAFEPLSAISYLYRYRAGLGTDDFRQSLCELAVGLADKKGGSLSLSLRFHTCTVTGRVWELTILDNPCAN